MSDVSAPYDLTKALDPAASVFVSANAGAGKTSLLANRVLRLLLHGVPPAKILCLTFTNAAAAEMTTRVQKELGAWVMDDDAQLEAALARLTGQAPDAALKHRARALFAQVLEAPEGIRIQTIHGFCQSLLRRFPIEAGISPYFTVMDSRTEQELLKEARQRLFSRTQDDPVLQAAINEVAREAGEWSFNALVGEIIQHKRRIRALFSRPNGVEAAINAVWRLLKVPKSTTAESLMEAHFDYDDATIATLRRIASLLLAGGTNDKKMGQGMAEWVTPSPGRGEGRGGGKSTGSECWTSPHPASPLQGEEQKYIALFMTKEGKPRQKLSNKGTLDAAHVEAFAAEQARIVGYCEAANALAAARRTTNMLHIAESLLAVYDALRRAGALLDYDGLILTASQLLQKPGIAPWVLFKLDGGIDHVLVDEAQDTSPEQWAIIDALTQEFFAGLGRDERERSLFIVGDEKQSIYSFQGADPSGLGRMQRYFSESIRDAAMRSHHIALTRSFRSTAEVLAGVDAVFAQDSAKAGLMFSDAPMKHTPTRDAPGLVEIWPLLTPPEDEAQALSPSTQLARSLADTIQGWLTQGLWLESKQRPVQAGDIMILVRSRTSLVDRLVRALKRRGVPVAGHDRMALSDNLAVQDLIALGHCLLLPEDDLTLAAVLKSPVCGVSEEALFELSWQRGGMSLWQRLQTQGGEAYALLADLRARADFVPPFELYAYLLDTLGIRRRFTGRMGEEYHDPIDEFLNQALLYERSHAASLQGFLQWLGASDSDIKRDMEQAKNAVRIMTVHGAKGLQAPIVILPDTVEKPKMKDRLLWHAHDSVALPFWPASAKEDGAFCSGLRAGQFEAMLAEYRRLLYVALTRAEDRLYICGASGREKAGEQSWYQLVSNGLATVAEPFEMPGGTGLRLGKQPHGTSERQAESALVPESPGFDFLTQPAPSEPVPPHPLTPSRLVGEEPAAASPLSNAVLYQRGTFIHKLLQHLPDVLAAERLGLARKLALMYAQAMPPDMVETCIAEVLRVLDDPASAFLFEAGGLAEVPVAGCVTLGGEQVPVAGQIDRLCIGEREVWIVDFKSNRAAPANAAAIPLNYRRQLQLYRLLLAQIYPDKAIRCALLWTALPRIDILDNALLDEWGASSYI